MNYDFESILGRLKEGLSGKVSAMEGTVTGDILQAVAAELARIWSQEVDSVTQRGFVSTAQGTWLDAACGDYGITRKEGESDESLRQRTLEHIRRQGAAVRPPTMWPGRRPWRGSRRPRRCRWAVAPVRWMCISPPPGTPPRTSPPGWNIIWKPCARWAPMCR